MYGTPNAAIYTEPSSTKHVSTLRGFQSHPRTDLELQCCLGRGAFVPMRDVIARPSRQPNGKPSPASDRDCHVGPASVSHPCPAKSNASSAICSMEYVRKAQGTYPTALQHPGKDKFSSFVSHPPLPLSSSHALPCLLSLLIVLPPAGLVAQAFLRAP
ncbi:uncharacterized protein CLUP02_03628 [Colletotrichum lupini]|uniref:Uncharacterized protein n=1 Tax=Colletotrichum lupini TaxID=145971 RepID=A0A9Q8SIT2_9PEZI|nr:uncharacterized protein CLUP02_03628 [Colletotrichum lupini]UQC78154.1 hypothetical protein CLUP02_03628 [Colletotrichum lupini]